MECPEIKQEAKKRPVGAPTLYKAEYNEKVYKLCLLGATDAEIADILDVSESTLNLWKINHPEFSESMRAGKVEADAEIAHSLYHAAKGYEHAEDVIMQYQGQPVIVPTVKHYAPDTKAAALWLKNRQPERWKDEQKLSVSGTVIHQVVPATPAELQERLSAAQAAISKHSAVVDAEVIESKTEPI